MAMDWRDLHGNGPQSVESLTYPCPWCRSTVSSNKGSEGSDRGWDPMQLRFCPKCDRPTVVVGSETVPAQPFGEEVTELPEDVGALYEEARLCTGHGATHAAVMVARKVLMHVAVDKGADEGKPFKFYIDYLEGNGLVGPGTKDWVDEIRKLGNETNHEIRTFTEDDARLAVDFLAMLLRLVYEYPARARKRMDARGA